MGKRRKFGYTHPTFHQCTLNSCPGYTCFWEKKMNDLPPSSSIQHFSRTTRLISPTQVQLPPFFTTQLPFHPTFSLLPHLAPLKTNPAINYIHMSRNIYKFTHIFNPLFPSTTITFLFCR